MMIKIEFTPFYFPVCKIVPFKKGFRKKVCSGPMVQVLAQLHLCVSQIIYCFLPNLVFVCMFCRSCKTKDMRRLKVRLGKKPIILPLLIVKMFMYC